MAVLTAAQEADKASDARRETLGGGRRRPSQGPHGCPRVSHLPVLQPGETKPWGPHIIEAHGESGFRCLSCARTANHKRAKYALKTLSCTDRPRLAGGGLGHRRRKKWNTATERRWAAQGDGGHRVFRYNATRYDGRFLCTRCGLRYVRRCDLISKHCPGEPATQRAAEAIQAALRGEALAKRRVHAFAKYPARRATNV